MLTPGIQDWGQEDKEGGNSEYPVPHHLWGQVLTVWLSGDNKRVGRGTAWTHLRAPSTQCCMCHWACPGCTACGLQTPCSTFTVPELGAGGQNIITWLQCDPYHGHTCTPGLNIIPPFYFRVVILNKRYRCKLMYDDVRILTKQKLANIMPLWGIENTSGSSSQPNTPDCPPVSPVYQYTKIYQLPVLSFP